MDFTLLIMFTQKQNNQVIDIQQKITQWLKIFKVERTRTTNTALHIIGFCFLSFLLCLQMDGWWADSKYFEPIFRIKADDFITLHIICVLEIFCGSNFRKFNCLHVYTEHLIQIQDNMLLKTLIGKYFLENLNLEL